jgi:hypothetical protein
MDAKRTKSQYSLTLVIVRRPDYWVDELVDLDFQSVRFEFSWEKTWENTETWYPLTPTRAISRVCLVAPLEAVAEEQYEKFSEVVVPTDNGLYESKPSKGRHLLSPRRECFRDVS